MSKTNEEYVEEFKHKFSGEDSFISRYDYDIIDFLLTILEAKDKAKDKECEERVRDARIDMFEMIKSDIEKLQYDTDGDTFKKIILSRLCSIEWFEALTPTTTDKTTEV